MKDYLGSAIAEEEKELPYKSLGLQRNPFPGTPVPEDEPTFLFARGTVAEEVAKRIVRAIRERDPQHFVVLGQYGSGKSHILKYFKHEINARFFPEGKSVAAYVNHPGKNFQEFYRNLIEGLSLDFFGSLYRRFEDVEKQDSNGQRRPELLNVLKAAAADTDSRFTAWQWLQGNRQGRLDLEKLGIGYSNHDADRQLETLASLLTVFNQTGPSSLVIFLDEFEELTTLRSDFQTTYLNHLRRLIDISKNQVLLVVSATPEGFDVIRTGGHALVRRLAVTQYVLEPLTPDETWDLIRGYLELASTSPGAAASIIDRGSSDEIQRIMEGRVSEIVRACHDLIESARSRKLAKIDPVSVRQLIPGSERPGA